MVPDFFAGSVFCNWAAVGNTTYERIGVQAHVSNLVRGRMVDATRGESSDMALYSGFTTGASKSNTVCSLYAPITWQVDCKCRPVSASSFDKMCADMKAERDDMSVLSQLSVQSVMSGQGSYNSNRPRVYLFCSSILQTEFFIPSGILFFIIKLKSFNPNLPRALG